jgi:hypothetical protein
MGHVETNLVRRAHEALRGGKLSDTARRRMMDELHARVRRLRGKDEKYGAVTVSRHVEDLCPLIQTA